MAGWISSKLKVAENLLHQIDQQAAESLGKSERKEFDDLDFNTSPKPTTSVSLRDQFKKKKNESIVNPSIDHTNSISPSKVSVDCNADKPEQQRNELIKPDLSYRSSALNDTDWTELLGTPKHKNSVKTGRVNGVLGEHGPKRGGGTRRKAGVILVNENGGVGDKRRNGQESGNRKDSQRASAGSNDKTSEGLKSIRNLGQVGVSDEKEWVDRLNVDNAASLNKVLNSKKHVVDADLLFLVKEANMPSGSEVTVTELVHDDDKDAVDDGKKRGDVLAEDNNNPHVVNHVSEDFKSGSYSGSVNVSDSDSDSECSSSDSEGEREREARIQRRRQILAAKAAVKAAEAIKEHENLVARLEGEKQSLEKIVEERAKQAAQEASELQSTMMETIEAAELEKQKHNHTRMEVLTRLAKLEAANVDLAKSLATAQWNLELEVNRIVDFRQQVEEKGAVHEELRRRISSTYQTKNSLTNVMLSRGIGFEKEMLEAEYSSLTDKVAGLQEKARKLEVNVNLSQKEIGSSTEVEVELKRRLHQMTDYLIQKQAQVEALSCDKAMLIFRIEAVTRLLDENKPLINATDLSNVSRDVEVGTCNASGSKLRPMFEDRIQSGKQHLGSLLRQLDAVFSAGAVSLARNPVAKLWVFVYLVCLHLWVLYILFSHSWTDVTSTSVLPRQH